MFIIKKLYGLKTSGELFYDKFDQSMIKLRFKPSYKDSGVCVKYCVPHDEYVVTWVDDTDYKGKDTNRFYESLHICGYKFKVLGTPTYHLGGYFK